MTTGGQLKKCLVVIDTKINWLHLNHINKIMITLKISDEHNTEDFDIQGSRSRILLAIHTRKRTVSILLVLKQFCCGKSYYTFIGRSTYCIYNRNDRRSDFKKNM